jgi:hypothetical protein
MRRALLALSRLWMMSFSPRVFGSVTSWHVFADAGVPLL